MSSFWQKQSQYLLENELYAWGLVALLAFIPFAAWVSLAVVALVTLRKSPYHGFKALIIGIIVATLASRQAMSLPYNDYAFLATFVLGYLAAVALRYAVDWTIVVTCMLVVSLSGIVLIHWLSPEYITEQYQSLISLFQAIEKNGSIVQLLDGQRGANTELLANYLLGVKAFCIAFSALSSLMLARFIQSQLFYPGGFRKEILNFRAGRIGVLLLVCSAFSAYQGNAVAISCLPILVVYCMAAGMCLMFNMMRNKRDLVAVILLIVPLIAIPYIMLPIYVFFGSLDGLFNFRLRLASKLSE